MPDTGESTLVEYDCSEHIATITLNRPDKLNAVNDDMVRQIASALRRFDTDDNARVAILCGRGRAFSSGADVQQRQLRSVHAGGQAVQRPPAADLRRGGRLAGQQRGPLPERVQRRRLRRRLQTDVGAMQRLSAASLRLYRRVEGHGLGLHERVQRWRVHGRLQAGGAEVQRLSASAV